MHAKEVYTTRVTDVTRKAAGTQFQLLQLTKVLLVHQPLPRNVCSVCLGEGWGGEHIARDKIISIFTTKSITGIFN